MPILIQSPDGPVSAEPELFESENELETVVASKPDLLVSPGDQPLAFVARQLDLPEAGLLDLLFVTESGFYALDAWPYHDRRRMILLR